MSEASKLYYHYSLEDKAPWRDLYENKKMSAKEIAELTGASVSTILRYLKEKNVFIRPLANSANSDDFRLDQLYLVKLQWRGDVYIKVGRTFQSLKSRHPFKTQKPNKPICVKVLGVWKATHKDVVALEQKVLKEFSSFAVSSTYSFEGYTECFDEALPIEKVISFIEKQLTN